MLCLLALLACCAPPPDFLFAGMQAAAAAAAAGRTVGARRLELRERAGVAHVVAAALGQQEAVVGVGEHL